MKIECFLNDEEMQDAKNFIKQLRKKKKMDSISTGGFGVRGNG